VEHKNNKKTNLLHSPQKKKDLSPLHTVGLSHWLPRISMLWVLYLFSILIFYHFFYQFDDFVSHFWHRLMVRAELWGHIVTSLAKTILCLVTLFSTLNIPLSPVDVLTCSLAKWCTMCDCLHIISSSFILSCQRNLTSKIFFNFVTRLDFCGCIISFHV
jgi:hypothetical protein